MHWSKDPRGLTGALLGLLVGAADYILFTSLGIGMRLGTFDVTFIVCAFFAGTYALVGFAFGRLLSLHRALAASKEQLAASQRKALENETLAAIGRLAAGVAHEVRNPLAVIRSSVELLREGLEEGDERAEAGDFVVAEVDRLNRYVRSLLDFSRPLSPETSPVALVELARQAMRRAEELWGKRPIAAELAAEAPEATAEADRVLLDQVLLGLLANAEQAMEEGGRVELRVRRGDEGVLLEVADSGPGIDAETQAALFRPFFTTRTDGTGLGLAMARRIVEAHGGSIRYRPRRGAGPGGRGACFEIALPEAAA